MSKAKLNALLEEFAGNQRRLDTETLKLDKAIEPHVETYKAAVGVLETRFRAKTAETSARQAELLKEIEAVMTKCGLSSHETAAAIAELGQAKEREIDPARFLDWAGKKNREGALSCLKVEITKADKVFGKDTLAGITTEKNKGKPKLAVKIKE